VGTIEINTVTETDKPINTEQELTNKEESFAVDGAPQTTAAAFSDAEMSAQDSDDLQEQHSVDDILLKNLLSRKTSIERRMLPKNQFLRELLEGHYKRRKLNL
jgi:hypothetical protein